MFDPVRPYAFSPIDAAEAAPTGAIDAFEVRAVLHDASFVDRPALARDVVAGMDDAGLAAFARQDGGTAALGALDDALSQASVALDVSSARERIARALRHGDDEDTTAAGDTAGITRTTAHIGDNTVTWTNDGEGRPIRAEADLTEVFRGIDRSSAETRAQRESADRGVEGDQGGHVIGHRFVRDQGLKNLFPQNGNFNVSAYKTLENEWADWIDSGKDVHITVELAPKEQDRPERVRVSYEVTDPVDGRVVYDQRVTFRNEAGQHFDRVPHADMADA